VKIELTAEERWEMIRTSEPYLDLKEELEVEKRTHGEDVEKLQELVVKVGMLGI